MTSASHAEGRQFDPGQVYHALLPPLRFSATRSSAPAPRAPATPCSHAAAFPIEALGEQGAGCGRRQPWPCFRLAAIRGAPGGAPEGLGAALFNHGAKPTTAPVLDRMRTEAH